jgi:hypothetical protein
LAVLVRVRTPQQANPPKLVGNVVEITVEAVRVWPSVPVGVVDRYSVSSQKPIA